MDSSTEVDRRVPGPLRPIVELTNAHSSHLEILPLSGDSLGSSHASKLGLPRKSALHVVARHCSALLFHHGFIRILGAGHHPHCLRSLVSYNKGKPFLEAEDGAAGALIVADDVVGGTFAINAGGLPATIPIGEVAYFCPEGLQWDGLGITFARFVQWCCTQQFLAFYEPLLWLGWEEDASRLTVDQTFAFEPMIYKKQGVRKKRIVEVDESYDALQSMHRKLYLEGNTLDAFGGVEEMDMEDAVSEDASTRGPSRIQTPSERRRSALSNHSHPTPIV